MAFSAELDDFAALYERTYASLFHTVLGICGDATLAADLTQDAYIQAYRRRSTFRGEVPAEAWLRRIAVNAALSGLRRGRVRWAEPLDPAIHDRPTAPPLDLPDSDVQDALMTLQPMARAAIVLRYYVDLDYASIATILGTSTGNVGSLLSRALERLRRELLAEATLGSIPASPAEEASHGR